MSVSVHVHGGPISIHRDKTVILSDIEDLRKKELERRKKLRLEQVRHQSKEFSNSILHKVQLEKERNKENEKKEKEMELRQWQVERIKSLEQQYQDCLDSVRQSQDKKPKMSEEEIRKQKLLLEKENLRKARERGKQAMEKLKNDRQAEESRKETEQKQKHFKNTIEKLRSTLVTSKDVLKEVTTNRSVDFSPTASSSDDVVEIRTGQPVAPEPRATSQPRQYDVMEISTGQPVASKPGATSQMRQYDRSLYEASQTTAAGRERMEVNQNSSRKATNETETSLKRNTQSKSPTKSQQNIPIEVHVENRRNSEPERSRTEERHSAIIQTLASERQKLLEYKLKLENEERKRQLLEEKLRMEQQTRFNEQLREENERLKKEKAEEEEKRNTRTVLKEMREEESERRDDDKEEERKLEEYRRELSRLKKMKSQEELRENGEGRGRKRDKELMKFNIITSGRRSKSCRGSRQDSCLGHSSTDSDESFLSDKTWPPSQLYLNEDPDSPAATTRVKCQKCTSKKLSHLPAAPSKSAVKHSTSQRTKPPAQTSSAGVFDRNLRAFEKERLHKDFKKLLGELEHLSREERRIKSRGCLLHDDPTFHMSETRKKAAEELKQNKMASAFEQISAGFPLNCTGAKNLSNFQNTTDSRGVQPKGFSKSYLPNEALSQTGIIGHTGTLQAQEETDNIAKLKELLDRVNQKREIIMKEIMNPKNQAKDRPNRFDDPHMPSENSRAPNANLLNPRFNVGFDSTGNERFAPSEIEKEFERILLQQATQQTMVSKEIQVSPSIDSSNPMASNENRLNHSKSTTSSAAQFSRIQTAVWTHVGNENDPHPVRGTDKNNKRDEATSPIRPIRPNVNDPNVLEQRQLFKNSMQQIVMHSQEVQTNMEIETKNNSSQEAEDPHNASTWAEDLQVQNPSPHKTNRLSNEERGTTHQFRIAQDKEANPQTVSPNVQKQQFQQTGTLEGRYSSPNARIRRTISQQSEITTIKAAQRHETNNRNSPMTQNQYVYQVETTSSTTEIEVSNLETAYDDRRSRKKKHRGGKNDRKSIVAFPPSPIAKVKQVRKTLFNNNIEVIVNIKDDLLDDVARGNLSDDNSEKYPEQGQNRQSGSIKDRNRHIGSVEDQNYRQPCSYYQDENRLCVKHYPFTRAANKGQCCRKHCQSNCCYCAVDMEENFTDETRSSYLSPPRSMKTLHEKEINNLISQHSLHGNLVQADNVENYAQRHRGIVGPRENGNRREQMEGLEYDQHYERNDNGLNKKLPRSHEDKHIVRISEQKPGIQKRSKQIGTHTIESNIKDEIPRVIHENLKLDSDGKLNKVVPDNNNGTIKKKAKKPVESVPQNQELMNYIVTLLNMDKKDIAGIPIEVSDVSIASELFTSTSEQSDRASDNDINRQCKNMNDKPTGVYTKPVTNDRVENSIDVCSRRNQNILAQKYSDIIHQEGKHKGKHLRANYICSKTEHLSDSRVPTNIETQRFEDYRADDKRPCNTNVWKPTANITINNVPYRTKADTPGPSNLAKSIANAGSKLPYKEIFKSNLHNEPVIQSKYKAVAPLLNCQEPPYRNPDVALQYYLNKKVEENERDRNQHQTNFDVLSHKRKTSKVPTGFDQVESGHHHKHQQSHSRSDKRDQQNDGNKQTSIIREVKDLPNYHTKTQPTRNICRGGPLKTQKDVSNKPHDLHTRQYNDFKTTSTEGSKHPVNQSVNTSVQTTKQSGDESTIYLNIPRRFQNVDNVGVQERRDQSMDTSDLIKELNINDPTRQNVLSPNKWKASNEIRTGLGMQLDDRRKYMRDICAEVDVEIGEQRPTAGPSDGMKRTRNEHFNGSMDLQVPDVRLERPLSQQNSKRKSPCEDLNSSNFSHHHPASVPHQQKTPSTGATGWNNVESLVEELMRRNIIDRPFPWLTTEEPTGPGEHSGALDETNLTEMLQRLLESDSGSSSAKTPPIADTGNKSPVATTGPTPSGRPEGTNPAHITEGVQKFLLDSTPITQGISSKTTQSQLSAPVSDSNGTTHLRTSNQLPESNEVSGIATSSLVAKSHLPSNGAALLNRTTDSMQQRKTDLMSIFEAYKRDIQALLNVLPSPESAGKPPSCDLDTIDQLITPLDSEQATNQTSPTDLDNPLLQDSSETRDTSNNSNQEPTPVHVIGTQPDNEIEKNISKRPSLIKSDEGIGTSTNRTNKENASSPTKSDENTRGLPDMNRKEINTVQPMTSEEFIQQLKALTVTSDTFNVRQEDTDRLQDRVKFGKNENIANSRLDEDADFLKLTEANQTSITQNEIHKETTANNQYQEVNKNPKAYDTIPNVDDYQALSAQLSQIVRDNESLNAEWNQLLSSGSIDSSSEDIEKRLAAIVQSVDSGRSGSGTAWMGTTYKTLRQRQREMLDSSATTSPEENRKPPPRGRKPRRVSPRLAPGEVFRSLHDSINSTTNRGIEQMNISQSGADNQYLNDSINHNIDVGENSDRSARSLKPVDSFADFKSLNDSIGSLGETTGEKLCINYENFLREREIALGKELGKRTHQSLEHQAHFDLPSDPPQTTPENPPSNHPRGTTSSKKYTSSTPVKKTVAKATTGLLDASKPLKLCLCIPCTLCEPQVASCEHAFVCKPCCHDKKQDRDVTGELRLNSELSVIVQQNQNEIGSSREASSIDDDVSL